MVLKYQKASANILDAVVQGKDSNHEETVGEC